MSQDSSLDFKLVQRICLLQQALDQATHSLEELQEQVANHQMLQAHLAQTEEYSNVQQKIIHNLQQQLAAKDNWQHEVLETLLDNIQRLVAEQQQTLERLRLRLNQSQIEVQHYLRRIKPDHQPPLAQPQAADAHSEVMIVRALTVSLSSQLQSAQQHLHQLDHILIQHQITFARVQAQLQGGDTADGPRESGIAASTEPSPPVDAEADLNHLEDPAALRAVIEAQRRKIAELSHELDHQVQQHTSLKVHYQAIAGERDRLKQQNQALQPQASPGSPSGISAQMFSRLRPKS